MSTASYFSAEGGLMVSDEVISDIRDVLAQQGRLPVEPSTLKPNDDLFEAGMSSHASVNVMLALEDRFDIEFPDAMLTRSAFSSIGAIASAVGQLQTDVATS
jgi:acyl carrier protein